MDKRRAAARGSIDLQRDLLPPGQQYPLKGPLIWLMLKLIARKKDLQAAARRLSIQMAQSQEFIGSDQNVDHPGHIRHTFQPIQLVDEPDPAGDLQQMLR